MITSQQDLRKTNLVIDDILVVHGKLVATDSEFKNVTIRSGTLQATEVSTQTMVTQTVTTMNGSSTTPGTLLVAENLSEIVAGEIPEFTTDNSTIVRSIPKSVFMGNTLRYFFEDGSDGNVTISGGTMTLTRDMYYDTLTIDPTGVLIPAGFVVFCKTACINNGVIHMNGGNGGDGTGVAGGAGGTPTTSSGALISGQTGKTGGAPAANGANAVGTATSLGGLGGVGGNSATQTGGTVTAGLSFIVGTEMTYLKNVAFWPMLFRVNAVPALMFGGDPGGGGSGGAGGVGAGGGGGGAGGGWIMIVASSISGSGTFESNGGVGGNGFSGVGAGGGGGGGGVVYFLSLSNSIVSSQVSVNGGVGGTGFSSGASGNLGTYQNNILTA